MSAADSGRNNPVRNRTLLDIIRDDRSIKDKKSWKTFRDKLRLKRAGSAWTSSVHVPTSDVNVQSSRPRSSGRGEDRVERVPASSNPPVSNSKTQSDDSADATMKSEAPRSKSLKPPRMVRHASIRISSVNADEDDEVDDSEDDDYGSSGSEDGSETPVEALTQERSLSAREAVAAQEAAEAAAAAATGTEEPVKMSLMDLLGETGYVMGEEENDDEEEEEDEDIVVSSRGGMEYTCCVCMVRHKGSAFIPCAHTFCRLCSRELMVQRGNCPLCRGYILEILDIF
ncbi:hypothetical protein like AT3G07120 [Hibiscus trionum]|uniref:RING-type domain-containing protein n=1 Tax=Hibiscus trionum TaxID=183268 RepID=A0A9W7HCW2_HIBTR|nr:hypothetical protein like AT3G07120 [Hibiscus trionum]